MLVMKPKIRRAIEGMPQGMMFQTVVSARTHYSEQDVSALADAYTGEFMPEEKKHEGTDPERAVRAVRAQLKKLEAKAKEAAESPSPVAAVPAESAKPEPAP